jgi:hypothetical protein
LPFAGEKAFLIGKLTLEITNMMEIGNSQYVEMLDGANDATFLIYDPTSKKQQFYLDEIFHHCKKICF